MFTCPVCGYDQLRKPPADHTICPSCGVQFGYNDAGPLPLPEMHQILRRKWINLGLRWHSRVIPQPVGWNAYVQLINAGFGRDLNWTAKSILSPRAANHENVRLVDDGELPLQVRGVA